MFVLEPAVHGMAGAEGKTLAVYLIYYLKHLIKYWFKYLVRAIKKTKIVKIHVRFVKQKYMPWTARVPNLIGIGRETPELQAKTWNIN